MLLLAKVGYQLVTVKFAILAFNALNDICITTYVSIRFYPDNNKL